MKTTFTISEIKHSFFLDILCNNNLDYLVKESEKENCYDIIVNSEDLHIIENDEDYEYCIS